MHACASIETILYHTTDHKITVGHRSISEQNGSWYGHIAKRSVINVSGRIDDHYLECGVRAFFLKHTAICSGLVTGVWLNFVASNIQILAAVVGEGKSCEICAKRCLVQRYI